MKTTGDKTGDFIVRHGDLSLADVISIYNDRGLGQCHSLCDVGKRPGTKVRYALAELVNFWNVKTNLSGQDEWLKLEIISVYHNKKVV